MTCVRLILLIQGPPSNVFFSTSAYFVNGNTQLMSDLTDNQFYPVFEDRIISLRADVVWPPRSCDLTPLAYYLWGVVKDKCYADKPETIDALKDNIREAITAAHNRCA